MTIEGLLVQKMLYANQITSASVFSCLSITSNIENDKVSGDGTVKGNYWFLEGVIEGASLWQTTTIIPYTYTLMSCFKNCEPNQ